MPAHDRAPTSPPRLVPVIGTGFNRWLLGGTDAPAHLTDWWAFLRHVAERNDLRGNAALWLQLESEGDATFAWESLVLAFRAQRAKSEPGLQAAAAERRLLHAVAADLGVLQRELVARHPVIRQRALRFADALAQGQPKHSCDVLSLNFDTLLHAALAGGDGAGLADERSRAGEAAPAQAEDEPDVQPAGALEVPGRALRVWHPHGHIGQPASMVLGTHRYVQSASAVVAAFARFKRAERSLGAEGTSTTALGLHRRHDDPGFHSWVAVAINEPLLLLGTGLAREEVDLWEFLHLRARNHAGVPSEQRPAIWRLACTRESAPHRAHWKSVSPGIAIRHLPLGTDWSDAWEHGLTMLHQGALR